MEQDKEQPKKEQKEQTLLWAEQLLAEVREFDPTLFVPKGPVGKARIVGDCPESAKRFFSLAMFYERECKRIKLEAEFQGQEAGLSQDDLVRDSAMDQKHDTLMEMFWGEVHSQLNTWGLSIGLRAGWKIVEVKDDNPLKKLLGGIIEIPLP